MNTARESEPLRVLHSFPHKLGGSRICNIAWHQVQGIAAAGAKVIAMPGVVQRPVSSGVLARPTLARGKWRIPYKVLGRMRALALHDFIVARRLERLAGKIDVVHAWPTAALRTLKVATRLGIPTVLERPNAHTRFAYDVVDQECRRLGIGLPRNHEHAFHLDVLLKEEREYELADKLLCPSDFVRQTFLDRGFPEEKLLRHIYGYDEKVHFPSAAVRSRDEGLVCIFVGGCAPRKGLHFALDAWLQSSASRDGRFLIAGAFVQEYARHLAARLAHPGVEILGHRNDVPELMRNSDILLLPSIEEGSALVTYEGRANGCVLLVSDASGAVVESGWNGLVHPAGNVAVLSEHLSLLDRDRTMLQGLRAESLRTVSSITWTASGARLVQVYREAVQACLAGRSFPAK
jgi:glycosyltransferase involved in cell wall biosynthesis